MSDHPFVLCPVDFSEASRGALRCAVAIAEHFHGSLTVATINDPLLAQGAAIHCGEGWLSRETAANLEAFVDETLHGRPAAVAALNLDIATGKAAAEIREIAERRHVDLVVMSSHGLTGVRKFILGSTTERVLRETATPVLVTPAHATAVEAANPAIRCVLAPVDLSEVSGMQMHIAASLAEAFDAALVVAHVLDRLQGLAGHENLIKRLRATRRTQSEESMRDLMSTLPASVRASLVMASGDPAEEIPHIIERSGADLVVMGLHASIAAGPRMGSITYRVLSRTQAPVLALPPFIPYRTTRAFMSGRAAVVPAGPT
jgi:nucleotide-binding universal stress UspA family protein